MKKSEPKEPEVWVVDSIEDGILADVAPTVLKLLGIPQPPEMTGKALH